MVANGKAHLTNAYKGYNDGLSSVNMHLNDEFVLISDTRNTDIKKRKRTSTISRKAPCKTTSKKVPRKNFVQSDNDSNDDRNDDITDSVDHNRVNTKNIVVKSNESNNNRLNSVDSDNNCDSPNKNDDSVDCNSVSVNNTILLPMIKMAVTTTVLTMTVTIVTAVFTVTVTIVTTVLIVALKVTQTVLMWIGTVIAPSGVVMLVIPVKILWEFCGFVGNCPPGCSYTCTFDTGISSTKKFYM